MTDDLPLLRGSERKDFKRCPQRWHWAWRDGLKSTRQKTPLWFGTGIHLAMEQWYIPGTTRGRDLRETWSEYCEGITELVRIQVASGDLPGDYTEVVVDAEGVGLEMLDNYLVEYGTDDQWEIISPEQTFSVRIPRDLFAKDMTPIVRFHGTFDIVARDLGTGRIWLWDHKGLRLTEQVMTPNGWTKNGDLVVGDLVVGSDGKPTEVTGVYDLGQREMFRVHLNDGSFVDTTDDHMWTVRRSDGRERVLTTIEMQEGKHRTYRTLPGLGAIQWPERDLSIDPYVLGVILGDGSLQTSVRITNPEAQIRSEVERYISTKSHRSKDRCETYALPNEVWVELKRMGLAPSLSWSKFVPEEYLYASERQRRDLLAGLLDTDGSVDPRGRTRFITTSEALKDGVEHLVRSLGGRAVSRKSPSYYVKDGIRHEARDSWCVNIVMEDSPFRLQRQRDRFKPGMIGSRRIVRVERLGEVSEARCIRVAAEDSLYVTRDCIVTHNTAKSIKTNHLPIDDQAGGYWAIADTTLRKQGLIGPKERINGILYNFLMKAPPDKRPLNEKGEATNKPVKHHYVEALMEHAAQAFDGGESAWANEVGPKTQAMFQKMKVADLVDEAADVGLVVLGDVSLQQPSPRLHREPVYRTSAERRKQIARIADEVQSMNLMREGQLPLYKTPTTNCTWDCDFYDLCLADEQGGDTELLKKAAYRVEDPYAAHREDRRGEF